jgi:hypothetical protein
MAVKLKSMVHHIAITKARVNLGQVVRRAHLNNEYFILEKDGIPSMAELPNCHAPEQHGARCDLDETINSESRTNLHRERNVVIQGYFQRWKKLGSCRTIDCADHGIKARSDWVLVDANAENVVSLSHTHLQKHNIIFLVLRHRVTLFLRNDSKASSNTVASHLHQHLNLARTRCMGNILQTHRIAQYPIEQSASNLRPRL